MFDVWWLIWANIIQIILDFDEIFMVACATHQTDPNNNLAMFSIIETVISVKAT